MDIPDELRQEIAPLAQTWASGNPGKAALLNVNSSQANEEDHSVAPSAAQPRRACDPSRPVPAPGRPTGSERLWWVMREVQSTLSLGQRLGRAARATGWLSLTHDILPAVASAVVTIVVTWAIAPVRPRFSWKATSLPLIAGAIALIAAYLIVNLGEFIVNCRRAGGFWRIERDQTRQDALMVRGRDVVIKDWVRNEFGKPELGVKFAAVFGSITESYPTRDIDVVVQLKNASDKVIRKRGMNLQSLNKAFEAEFSLPLHLQLFLEAEIADLNEFARRAGAVQILIGGDYWAEISDQPNSISSANE